MSIIDDLKKQRRLWIQSPCGHKFRAADAHLFDSTKPLKGEPLDLLNRMKQELVDERADFKEHKAKAEQSSRVTARAVTIGNVVEKIAPNLPGFPLTAADCRSLFEPIDYVLFKGLSTTGRIDALGFIEIKSGKSQLTNEQRAVRDLVESGKVEFIVANDKEDEP